jgi:hypothetical protein
MDQGKLWDRYFPATTPLTVGPSPPSEHPPVASAPLAHQLPEVSLDDVYACLFGLEARGSSRVRCARTR